MKPCVFKALFVLLLGILPQLNYADVPGTTTFQAYLSDASGNPVEGATDITFFIPGTDWTEQHLGVSVNKGVFSVLLGNQMSLANVDFSQVLQLHIEVNGISQTIPISSVPYAFHAKTVEHDSDTLKALNCASGQIPEWNGSNWVCADKASGPEGSQGPKGEKGDKGDPGPQGVAGPEGPPGQKGEKGDQGLQGVAGQTGPVGPQGPKGEKGDKGDPGLQGVAGQTGPAGPQGPRGEKGDKGDSGPQGVTGQIGPQGPAGQTGSAGPQGPKGEKGDKGDQGLQGPQGPKGEKGDKGDPGPQGDKGEPGPQGTAGPQANMGSVFIRWGNAKAPEGTTLLYSGFAFNEHYTQGGGSAEPICVKSGDPGASGPGSNYGDLLYPLGTGDATRMPPGIRDRTEIKCAVCYAEGPSFEMWGSDTCPIAWRAVYTGYGMGGYYTHSTQLNRHCVDNIEFDSNITNPNWGAIWYGTVLHDNTDVGIYETNRYVKCAFCVKEQ